MRLRILFCTTLVSIFIGNMKLAAANDNLSCSANGTKFLYINGENVSKQGSASSTFGVAEEVKGIVDANSNRLDEVGEVDVTYVHNVSYGAALDSSKGAMLFCLFRFDKNEKSLLFKLYFWA